MAKKKNFWYVLVLTNDGPKFVTKIEHVGKMAHWNEDESPLELSESYAKDVALGLMMNFYIAYPVCATIELDKQPFYYDKGKFEWVWKEGKEPKGDD